MFGCRIRIYDCFDQRIGSQTVSTVQAGAGTFADGIETADAGLSVQVDSDTTAQIMGCRSYRDIILRDIDTDAEALLIDIGEMLFCFLRIFMGHIQVNVIFTSEFHLVIDRTCYDVTRGERQTFVVFLHELLSVQRT